MRGLPLAIATLVVAGTACDAVPVCGDTCGEQSGNVPAERTTPIGVPALEHPGVDAPARTERADLQRPAADTPLIDCAEDAIDFGTGAVGVSWTATVRCTNVGDVRAQALTAVAEHPAFRLVVPEGTVEPGESFEAELVFAPTDVGDVAAAVRLDERDQLVGELRASGRAISVQPCDLTASVASVDFQRVRLGAPATLDVDLTNEGVNDCLVHGLAIDQAGNEFSLPTVSGSFTVPGGETVRVPVAFAPAQPGAVSGAIEFQVSNPAAPQQSIPLAGIGAESCLVSDPAPLDFGIALPGCNTNDQMVLVRNTCSTPVTVTGLGALSGNAFEARYVPELPHELAAGGIVTFRGLFHAADERTAHGGFLVHTDEAPEALLLPAVGRGDASGVQVDTFVQEGRQKIDLLVVVDTSPDAADLRLALENNLAALLSFPIAMLQDWQIAVTTTGVDGSTCTEGTGAEAGRILPLDGSGPRILTPNTPNLQAAWSNAVPDGSCVQRRSAFEAVERALSPELLGVADDPNTPELNDGNLGFRRPGAKLAVLLVTDDDDESYDGLTNDQAAMRLYNFLHAMTPRWDPVRVSALTNFSWTNGLNGAERIVAHVEAPGGTLRPRSTTNFTEAIMDLGTAFGAEEFFYLRGVPLDVDNDGLISDRTLVPDIRVHRNGSVLLSRNVRGSDVWQYASDRNAVAFRPLFVPEPGDVIDVEYTIGCH